MMRYILSLFCLVLLAGLTFPCSSSAHSTKGRIKIDLSEKSPTVDDFAYFMESYVHRHFYDGKFEKTKNRFYVKEFKRVEQNGNSATVHFITLDNKEKSDFEDTMTFQRGDGGVWSYTEPSGTVVVVYTYVQKWGYFYKKYILPISIGGIAVAALVLAVLMVRRRKTAMQQPVEA